MFANIMYMSFNLLHSVYESVYSNHEWIIYIFMPFDLLVLVNPCIIFFQRNRASIVSIYLAFIFLYIEREREQ